MNKTVDYSEVQPSNPAGLEASEWEPPTHKYFGPKLTNGKTAKEPTYSHQEYPRFMYAEVNGKIKARVVKSDAERDSIGSDWKNSPAEFGYIGAPSFDQIVKTKNEAESEEVEIGGVETAARKPGRPPKA
jgi:hypothetical protein